MVNIEKRVKIASLTLSGLIFSIGAHAQNSVSLYGLLDGGFLFLNKTQNGAGGNGGKFVGFSDSGQLPSRFGVTGTEDLGGGLMAEFKLESGIDIGNGGYNNSNGNFFGRQAYVGLKGQFGEVKAGLQFSPFFSTLLELDPIGLSNFGSSILIYADNVAVTGAFNSNAVSYTSPVIAGLQSRVMMALGGRAGDFEAGRQYSASLAYRLSNLTVDAAFYDGNPGGTVQTIPPSNVAFEGRMIGAAYRYGKLKAKASFTNYKVASGGANNNVYGGGLEYAVTPAVTLSEGTWYTMNRNDSSSHSLTSTVGASYALSLATTFYGQVGFVNNRGSENIGLALGDAPATLNAPAGTTIGAVVGVRHLF